MKWKNALLDDLPADQQEALIAVDGVYYVTLYDAARKVFVLKEDRKEFFELSEAGDPVYWVEINVPPWREKKH
jgi:hypothetical protein